MKNSTKALAGLVVVGLVLVFWSDFASASTILDTTTDKFRTAAATFGSRIKFAGISLLFILAGIQLALSTLKILLKQGSMEDMFHTLIFQMIGVGFFAFLNQSSEKILPTIIDGFDLLGQKGSGLAELTPSYVINAGIDVIDTMVAAYNGTNSSILDVVSNIFPALLIVISAIIILICFVILAAQMALAMISGYFWMAVTPFLLGFAGISFTKDIALNVLKGGIAIGMKIMTIYFIAGVAVQLGPLIGEEATNITLTDWSPLFWVLASVMILAYLSMQVPKLAGDLMNGTASLSAGDAGSNMMMLAAGAVGAASVGGGSALGGAVQNGAGGASAGLMDAARAGLATGSVSGAAAGAAAGADAGAAAGASVAPPSGGSSSTSSTSGAPVAPPSAGSSAPGTDSGASRAVAPPAPAGSGGTGAAAQGGASTAAPQVGAGSEGQAPAAASSVAPEASSASTSSEAAAEPGAPLGDASTASASGGGSSSGGTDAGTSGTQPPEKKPDSRNTNAPNVQQRMRTMAEHMPGDQQAVGLQAGVRGNIDA